MQFCHNKTVWHCLRGAEPHLLRFGRVSGRLRIGKGRLQVLDSEHHELDNTLVWKQLSIKKQLTGFLPNLHLPRRRRRRQQPCHDTRLGHRHLVALSRCIGVGRVRRRDRICCFSLVPVLDSGLCSWHQLVSCVRLLLFHHLNAAFDTRDLIEGA